MQHREKAAPLQVCGQGFVHTGVKGEERRRSAYVRPWIRAVGPKTDPSGTCEDFLGAAVIVGHTAWQWDSWCGLAPKGRESILLGSP